MYFLKKMNLITENILGERDWNRAAEPLLLLCPGCLHSQTDSPEQGVEGRERSGDELSQFSILNQA